MFNSLQPHGLYRPWNSPGQNTRVGSLSLLQGIFPTQGWNPGLPLRRGILYQLSHKGSLRILYWVAYPFSSGSSQPRNWTGVCCIAAAAAAKSLQSCPTLQPHRRQPTRLPRPWDSPGKNTGVGCHFLLQCTKVKSESEVTRSCLTLSNPIDFSLPGSSIHGIFQARVLEWGAIFFSTIVARLTLILYQSLDDYSWFAYIGTW